MRDIPRSQAQSNSGASDPARLSRPCIMRIPGPAILTDLPKRAPAMRDELAIWRAFLSDEIDAIMCDEG